MILRSGSSTLNHLLHMADLDNRNNVNCHFHMGIEHSLLFHMHSSLSSYVNCLYTGHTGLSHSCSRFLSDFTPVMLSNRADVVQEWAGRGFSEWSNKKFRFTLQSLSKQMKDIEVVHTKCLGVHMNFKLDWSMNVVRRELPTSTRTTVRSEIRSDQRWDVTAEEDIDH